MEAQLKQIVEALKLLADERTSTTEDRTTTINNVLTLIGTFRFDPDNDLTFEKWISRNGKVIENHSTAPTERAELLLRSLGPSEYNQLRGRTSPKKPEDLTYTELKDLLTKMFGSSKSQFRRHHDILLVDRL